MIQVGAVPRHIRPRFGLTAMGGLAGKVPRVTALLASVDGAIGAAPDMTVSVTDDGLLRGDGVFEVVRLYRGRPFAMEGRPRGEGFLGVARLSRARRFAREEHSARLQHSAQGLRLEFDLTALRSEVDALLEENGGAEALLRIVLTRGGRRIAMTETV